MGVSVVGELAGFMGRWFYERIWSIHHPLTSPVPCAVRQGKGTRIAPVSLADRTHPGTVPSRSSQTTTMTTTTTDDDEAEVILSELSVLFFGEHSPRVSDQPKRVSGGGDGGGGGGGRPSWFYTVVKLFTQGHSSGLFVPRSLKALLTHHRGSSEHVDCHGGESRQ